MSAEYEMLEVRRANGAQKGRASRCHRCSLSAAEVIPSQRNSRLCALTNEHRKNPRVSNAGRPFSQHGSALAVFILIQLGDERRRTRHSHHSRRGIHGLQH